MKKYIQIIYLIAATTMITSLSGCLKDKVTLPVQNAQDYNQIYMPQAASSPLVTTLLFQQSEQSLVYGANYGGVGYPDADIPVTFKVATDSVAAYNNRNRTSYPLLPENSYKLGSLSAVIPKGQLSTPPLKISVKTEGVLDLFKEYLLPINVSFSAPVQDVRLNKSLSTTYYIVKASLNLSDFAEFDRSAWKVTFFSSQEINGEGPTNGRAALVLDNDINTFWHTRYSDTFANPPHILVIDMNTTQLVHGVSFVDRQNENRGRPMQVTIQTSINGTDWTSSDDFSLQSINDKQRMFFLSGFKNARYLKLIITKMYDNATHTHLAEFGAF